MTTIMRTDEPIARGTVFGKRVDGPPTVESIVATGMVGDSITFQNTGRFDPFPRLGHALQTDLLKLLRLRRILSVL